MISFRFTYLLGNSDIHIDIMVAYFCLVQTSFIMSAYLQDNYAIMQYIKVWQHIHTPVVFFYKYINMQDKNYVNIQHDYVDIQET